jgi:diguanylate cyclase (GGDEF)-like protein
MRPSDEVPEQPPLDLGALDLADHDDLTGLWNRRRFETELERRIVGPGQEGERLALLSIDVDGYRDVIHRHGEHDAQDLLRSISHALANRLRPSDTLARIGGDEFAALLSSATPHLVQSLANDLCSAVREQLHAVGSGRVHATVSIGAVFLGPGTPTLHDGLLAAEAALHEAKVGGCDRAILHEPSPGA